ncbi:Gfo/Idh/MocA family protein [Halobacteriales archaeon Cl-PHB]
MQIGIIGIGYWGQNLVRVFDDLAEITICCHTGSETNREWLRHKYPEIRATTDSDAIFTDSEIDAVVVATPIETHFNLVERAIRFGKDVFVEKPLATSHDRAVELADLAIAKDCCLFTGYIYVYHPLIRELENKISTESIRSLRFLWQKHGGFEQDILLDLMSHPVAIVHSLFGRKPTDVKHASGLPFVSQQDTIFVELAYDSLPVQVIIDRVSTHDTKSLAVGTIDGDTYLWDDESLGKLGPAGEYETLQELSDEPLRAECDAFIRAVESGIQPRTHGVFAADVNHTLERIRAINST